MHIDEILDLAIESKASDLHLVVGNPPMVRFDGSLKALGQDELRDKDTVSYAKTLLNPVQAKILEDEGHVDFSYNTKENHVFRINIFKYSGKIGIACRILVDKIPTAQELLLPDYFRRVSELQSGLVLVTGPTGCGKSTTIASIIDAINTRKNCHILTIEDPIEYVHTNKNSIITQREVGKDCGGFTQALRAGLRQDPDVIMVGELRDLETISTAITAAETGHLVLATLHTRNTHQTIDRIIDVFPSSHQKQIRVQLAASLMAVFSQRLLPKKDEVGRIVAVESLFVTPAIRNLIRESKVYQIYSMMQTGKNNNLMTMDAYLSDLYKNNLISRTVLIENMENPKDFRH